MPAPRTPRIDPSPLSAEDIRHALLRCWAAAIRDRQPPHQHAGNDAGKLAAALAHTLDALDARRRAGRSLLGMDETVRMLVGALRSRGFAVPTG